MRTIRIKLYKFDELSNDAKEKAIEWYRSGSDDSQIYADELIDSINALTELFNLKTGREYTDIRTGHIDDNILQLKGVRLYKYLINNYYDDLFKPIYIKSFDKAVRCKQFICNVKKDYKGDNYTQIYSKLKRDNSCVLTGVCYDMDILQPVYDFLEKIDISETFEGLISSIESAITKAFRSIEEDVNSSEYITEQIQANEYEFTKDGKRA